MTFIVRGTNGPLQKCEIRGYAAAAVEVAQRLEREGLKVIIENTTIRSTASNGPIASTFFPAADKI